MAAATQSSVGDDVSKEKDKIIVTLSLPYPSPIPKRRLVLTRSSPVVLIGRSSKVPSKGFIPADDNAWFDNPVMSRQHAELVAKFEDRPFSVYLKDVASFHGTFHCANDGRREEQRVAPNKSVKLTNGDTIRFGIDIFRIEKTYPPSSVYFTMERITQKQASSVYYERSDERPQRVFTVPDDVDDDEDDSQLDDELTCQAARAIMTRLELPNIPKSLPLNGRSPIDLTDDTDLAQYPSYFRLKSHMTSDVIDLTSEPTCASDVEQLPANHARRPIPRSIDLTSEPACLSDAEQVPTDYVPRPSALLARPSAGTLSENRSSFRTPTVSSLDHDGRAVFLPPAVWVDNDADSVLSQRSYSESIDSLGAWVDRTVLPDNNNISPGPDDLLSEMSDPCGYDDADDICDSNDDLDINTDTESVNSYDEYSIDGEEASDMDEDEDDEEDEEDDEDDEDDEDEDDGEEDNEQENRQDGNQGATPTPENLSGTSVSVPLSTTSTKPTHCEFTVTPKAGYDDISLPASMTPPGPLFEDSTAHTGCHNRDPSPSDAALVKRYPLLNNPPNAIRAQELGEKSGKFEFFAAREQNRATLNEQDTPIPVSAIRETLQATQTDGDDTREAVRVPNQTQSAPDPIENVPETTTIAKIVDEAVAQSVPEAPEGPEVPDASDLKLGDVTSEKCSAWYASGDEFLNSPPAADIPTLESSRSPIVDFDMTSAYKFQQSKLVAAAAALRSQTRRLPIQALLEPEQHSAASQPPQRPHPLVGLGTCRLPTPAKRSYDAAFDDVDCTESNRTCCATAPCPSLLTETKDRDQTPQDEAPSPNTPQNAPNQEATEIKGRFETAHEDNTISMRPDVPRPAKRMRVATVAAQVVACVALGGAATFSYLVNTAPVF
ncbi:hypothetical protein F4777DRAFT_575223 [Nemania sp. FL0916]|nr:hypothetical protein F4777DRAFT_575223 [Nemania sp. FL0916]